MARSRMLVGKVSRLALTLSQKNGVSEDAFFAPLRSDLEKAVRSGKARGWQLIVVENDGTETIVGGSNVQVDLPGIGAGA